MKNVEKSKKRKRSDTLATRNIERTLPRKRGTRGGLEYFRFHRKTSCSLPSSPPSSPGLLFVCLGYSTRHPRVCHSSFVTDPFFSFFFFSSLFPLVHAFSPVSSTFRTFSSSPPRLHDWARRNPDQWGGEASHSLSKLPRRFLPLSLSPSRSRIEHFVTK